MCVCVCVCVGGGGGGGGGGREESFFIALILSLFQTLALDFSCQAS